jgi:hypothetical protein
MNLPFRVAKRHAMAGEGEERGVALPEPPRERVEPVHQRGAVGILAGHHVEADLLERAADRPRVVHRLLQLLVRREIGVSVVADD